jgi:two-component system OmpR family response regulator
MRILVVEDDPETAAYVSNGLAEEGHVAETVGDGRDGLSQAMDEAYDILVVDRMLPGLDGLSLVRALRAVGYKVPVIFLTSLGGVDDRVDGLNVGGDDYLAKPFAFSELMARVNALARRPHLRDAETVLRVGDLEMDLIARKVTRGADVI